MANLSGSLTSPGMSPPFDPSAPGEGQPFTLAVSGRFAGTVVVMVSTDGGQTFAPSASQPADPAFATGNGAAVELVSAPGVIFAVEAMAPTYGAWTGELDYAFTTLLPSSSAKVTVAPGRTVDAGGQTYTAGQSVSVSRADADVMFKAGFITGNY